jgi:hypothetical protein
MLAADDKPANDGQEKRAIQHLSGTPQHSAYVIPSYIFRGDGQVIDLDAILAGLELGLTEFSGIWAYSPI